MKNMGVLNITSGTDDIAPHCIKRSPPRYSINPTPRWYSRHPPHSHDIHPQSAEHSPWYSKIFLHGTEHTLCEMVISGQTINEMQIEIEIDGVNPSGVQ